MSHFLDTLRARPLAVPPGALRAAPLRKQSFLRRIVGYAAEHLTRGGFPAIPMGRFPLMSFCCILYHFPLLHVLHVLHGHHLLFSCISCIPWFKPLRPLLLCVKYNCEYYRIRSRGKGNFVSLSCTRLVAWLFHRWRFACPDFSHASPVF